MWRSRQEDVVKPEGNDGKRRAGRDHGARKRKRILSKKINRLRPRSEASSIHGKPSLFLVLLAFLPCPARGDTPSLSGGCTATFDNLLVLITKASPDYCFNVRM